MFNRQAFLSRLFAISAIVLGLTYSVLVVGTIHNISKRKEVRAQISHTQVAISQLEENYFVLAGSINTESVNAMGFQESSDPIFAYTYDPRADINGFAMASEISRLK